MSRKDKAPQKLAVAHQTAYLHLGGAGIAPAEWYGMNIQTKPIAERIIWLDRGRPPDRHVMKNAGNNELLRRQACGESPPSPI